jgi:hypothetical protein
MRYGNPALTSTLWRMRPMLAAIAEKQRGIFVRRQAIASGYTRREFEHMTHGPGSPWVRLRYGVYAERVFLAARSDSERLLLLDDAALLVCDAGTVLSHSSAARRLRIPLYDADDGLSHLTRLRTDGRVLSRIQAGIKHHCGSLGEVDMTTRDGRPVTDPVRTVLDLTCEFGYRTGLVAADAVLRGGTAREDLLERAAHRDNLCHRPVLCSVAADADGGAESPIETLGRIVLASMGLTDLQPQFEIRLADGRSVFVDLYSPSLHHVFECDGRVKYREQLDRWGNVLRADDVVWLEKQREDAIRGLGFGFSRLQWRDTMTANLERTSARLWQEIKGQDAAGRRYRRGA